MGKLTPKEAAILMVFACSVVLMALAVVDFVNDGGMALEYVELSLTAAILARVI